MNLVDLLIILLLVALVVRGIRTGLMQLLLSTGGFVAGLLIGSQLAGLLAPLTTSPLAKLLIVMICEVGLAALLAGLGELAGIRLNMLARRVHLGRLDEALGALLALAFTLGIIWLGASALSNVQSYGIGGEIRQSFIVRKLNAVLPTPPDVLASLEKLVNLNGFPNVFLGLEPQHTTISPNNKVDNQAVLADEASVVQIKGEGCGGLVFGSGFVVDNGYVVTNAHVVAGIDSPEVLDASGGYPATPVWFDPDLDMAVLRVPGLTDAPLELTNGILPDSDAAAVLGYPGGGPLVVDSGVIIDHITATGRNIYNRGLVMRNIYEVQAFVEPGNSGGPLVAPDGTVAGIIFAKSVSQDGVGYALMIDQALPGIRQAIASDTAVGTGSCAAG